MRYLIAPSLLCLLASCSSDDSSSNGIPAEARTLESYEKMGVTLIIPRLSGFEARLPFLLNSGSAGANGLTFQPDATPGAPPFSYIFTVPLDGDANGVDETTVAGHATFNVDPANAGVGFGGSLDLTLTTAGGLGDLAADLDFTFTDHGREISGTGTFTEQVTGNVTTLTIDPAHPLAMVAATGTSSTVANACAYDLNGSAALAVANTTGTLASVWNFLPNKATVSVTNATFTDNSGTTTNLPNSNVTIPCGGSGSVSDWAGTYLQHWGCLPAEFGDASLTLTVTGNTVSISDEDPPSSGDINTYDATMVPGNAHVVRGYFIGGDPGNTYREDFSWTLSANSTGFSQISYYVYQEGPNQGSGGICGGTAARVP
jgi:hypothetical protein